MTITATKTASGIVELRAGLKNLGRLPDFTIRPIGGEYILTSTARQTRDQGFRTRGSFRTMTAAQSAAMTLLGATGLVTTSPQDFDEHASAFWHGELIGVDGWIGDGYADSVRRYWKVAANRHLVFVYGSLLKGLSNSWHLSSAEFWGRGSVDGDFAMLDLGAFPAVVRVDDGSPIVGELYLVDDDTLASLDRLESNGSLYQRERCDAHFFFPPTYYSGRPWVYLLADATLSADRPAVDGNDWRTARCAQS